MQSPPFPRYLVPPRSKYLYRHIGCVKQFNYILMDTNYRVQCGLWSIHNDINYDSRWHRKTATEISTETSVNLYLMVHPHVIEDPSLHHWYCTSLRILVAVMKASSYFTVTYTEIRRQVCSVHLGCRFDICMISYKVVLILFYNYIAQQEY